MRKGYVLRYTIQILEDENSKGWVEKVVHGVRLLCFAMILHTVYAYIVTMVQYQPTVAVENATSLCDLVVVRLDLGSLFRPRHSLIVANTMVYVG